MVRRWFGVILMAWAAVASLFYYVPNAQAANETYKFNAVGNIVGTGALNTTFIKAQNGDYVYTLNASAPGNACSIIYTISGVSTSGATSTGQILTVAQPAGPSCTTKTNLSGNITVTGAAAGGTGAGTFSLSTDAKSIAATGIVDGQGNGVTFTYNATNAEYEYTQGSGVSPVTDTITGLTTVANSTNYTATLTTSTGTSQITVTATKKDATPPATTGPTGSSSSGVNCVAASLTWLVCPVISLLVSVIDWIRQNIIQPLLVEPPFDKNDASIAPVYSIWSSFRDVASIFFILVFFLVIFGTAIGFDNYSIKKILPHLVAGAILMPFSWYICAIGIDIGNIIGQGAVALMNSIIPTPTIDFGSNLETVFYGAGAVTAGILATAALSGVSIGLLITIVVAVLATFFTLVLRKILIILLVVLSPFAILAWVLPNTQKLFKMWWTNLIRLIMMYPIILMLFEVGRLFSTVSGTVVQGTGTDAVKPLFQLTGLFLPLGLIPWTFSMAGGALKFGQSGINKLSGAANSRWGKDSAGAKERHQRFQERRAAAAADTERTGFRGGVGRAIARKQAGTGGFILNGAGIPLPGGRKLAGQSVATQAKQNAMADKHKDLQQKVKGANDAAADMNTAAAQAETEAEALRRSGDAQGASKKLAEAAAIRHGMTKRGQIDNLSSDTKSKIVGERATQEGSRMGKMELIAEAGQAEAESRRLRAAGDMPAANEKAAQAARMRDALTPGAKFSGGYEAQKEKAIQDRAALGAPRAARAEMGAAAGQAEAESRRLRANGDITGSNEKLAEAARLRSSLSATGQFAGGFEAQKDKTIQERAHLEGVGSTKADMAIAASRTETEAAKLRAALNSTSTPQQIEAARVKTAEAARLRSGLSARGQFDGLLDNSREKTAQEVASVEGARGARAEIAASARKAEIEAQDHFNNGRVDEGRAKAAEANRLRTDLSAEGQFALNAESQTQRTVEAQAALEGIQRANVNSRSSTTRQLEASATLQADKVFSQRIDQESATPISYTKQERDKTGKLTGKTEVITAPLRNIELDPDAIDTLYQRAEEAIDDGDQTKAAALLSKLGQTGGGRDRITMFQKKHGGGEERAIDGPLQTMWSQVMENVDTKKSPHLNKPRSAAFTDLKPADVLAMDHRTLGLYLDWARAKGPGSEELNEAAQLVETIAQDPRLQNQLTDDAIRSIYGRGKGSFKAKPGDGFMENAVTRSMVKNQKAIDYLEERNTKAG
jgi:hypothetical protein